MYHKVIFKDLNLQPGLCIKVVGDVAPDAKHFSVSVGQDELNLALHFNPRFSAYGDTKCIVYNYREDGNWSKEERDSYFPFVAGSRVEMYITFEENNFVMRMSDGFCINLPNHLHLKTLNFLSTTGDFNLKMLDFK